MRTLWPLLMALLITGCVSPDNGDAHAAAHRGSPRGISIDFQSGFSSDLVELKLNHENVFTGLITTDPIDGLAHSLEYATSTSLLLQVSVTLNKKQSFSYRIDLKRGRNIGFYRDLSDGQLHLDQRRRPFAYD